MYLLRSLLLFPFTLAFANPVPQLQFATEDDSSLSTNVTLSDHGPSCWPPRPLPPGLHRQCLTALDELMASVRAFEDLVFASFPDRSRRGHWIKVPYMKTVGMCEFKIYLQKSAPPYDFVTTRNTFAFKTSGIVRKCIADERYSGGGFLWIDINAYPPQIPERNALIVEFFPVGAELPVYAPRQTDLALAATTTVSTTAAVEPTFSASVVPVAIV